MIQRHEVDWTNDEDILSFVTERWENKDYYKRNLERQWLEMIATYEGYPYLRFDDLASRLVQDFKIPPWRVRLVINLMLPYVRATASKHVRNRPEWDVVPATNDTPDISIASAGKKTLRGYWYHHNINYKFIDILLWLGLTGNAFLKIYWNPDSGPDYKVNIQDFIDPKLAQQIQSPEEMQMLLQQAQQKLAAFVKENGSEQVALGDVGFSVRSPFDMLFPYGDNFYEVPWLIDSCLDEQSKYIEMGFKEDDFISPTQADARYVYYQKRVNNFFMMGYNGTEASSNDDCDKQLLRLEAWIPRTPTNKQLKDGYFCVVVGGKVIDKGPNFYNHRKPPYIHFGTEKTPGKIWHFSAASQVKPVMDEYQRTQSQIAEIKNLMAKPKWLVSKFANILDNSITDEPGEIIEYSGNWKPEQTTPVSIPNYIFNLLAFNRRDMDEIMAQRDATKGTNPPGVRSSSALANLQGQDDENLALIGLNLDTGWSIAGRLTLSTVDQFVKEDRLIPYTGERGRYEIAELKKGSLQGASRNLLGADYFNVRVTQYSQFGLTRNGQLEFLKVLLQYKVYDATERMKILKFISMGYFEDELDEFKRDRSNAWRENIEMSKGQPAFIDLSDHQPTHIEEHLEWMKGDDYKLLPPQLKSLYQQHVQDHKVFMLALTLEPQVLQGKAMIIACNLNGIPLPMAGAGANQNGSTTNSRPSGGDPAEQTRSQPSSEAAS